MTSPLHYLLKSTQNVISVIAKSFASSCKINKSMLYHCLIIIKGQVITHKRVNLEMLILQDYKITKTFYSPNTIKIHKNKDIRTTVGPEKYGHYRQVIFIKRYFGVKYLAKAQIDKQFLYTGSYCSRFNCKSYKYKRQMFGCLAIK